MWNLVSQNYTWVATSLPLERRSYASLKAPCMLSFGHVLKFREMPFNHILRTICFHRWTFGNLHSTFKSSTVDFFANSTYSLYLDSEYQLVSSDPISRYSPSKCHWIWEAHSWSSRACTPCGCPSQSERQAQDSTRAFVVVHNPQEWSSSWGHWIGCRILAVVV